MSDREHARTLLAIGRRDLKALRGMSDSTIFDDEVFGFHAQQAVEKTLKSWLSLLGVRYPRIHDLEELSATLESSGADAERRVTDLLGLTDFAVQMRYEAGAADGESLDRSEILHAIEALLEHVESLVG